MWPNCSSQNWLRTCPLEGFYCVETALATRTSSLVAPVRSWLRFPGFRVLLPRLQTVESLQPSRFKGQLLEGWGAARHPYIS